jgi:hypothetical protein
MCGSIISMFNILKNIILGAGVLIIVDAHDVHDNPLDDLSLAIPLGCKEVDLVSLVSNSEQRLD